MRIKKRSLLLALVIVTNMFIGCQKIDGATKVVNSNEESVQALAKVISKTRQRNAPSPLLIPTYDGGNEICHTGLVTFSSPWNGHKYWMGATPYPDGNDFVENPCVYYSDNMVGWTGISANPLATVTKKDEHLSDVALFYNDSNGTLECWWRWRYKPTFEVKIYRRTSRDGINWTPMQLLFTTRPETFGAMAAPAVMYENGFYKMYVTDMEGKMTYFTGSDATKLKKVTDINLAYEDNTYTGYCPWHQTIKKIGDTYYMVFSAYPSGQLKSNIQKLFYAESVDGITWKPAKLILEANKNSWDSRMIYQASFDFVDGQFCLYYSGFWMEGTKQKWRIGLLRGKSLDDLYPYEYKKNRNLSAIPDEFN
jgi:hypothetical protein